MSGKHLTLLFAAALALPMSAPAAAGPPAAAVRDWSKTVAMTPEGGMRMGNPAAPVKLVEYGSLACPHCRHFEETGYQPLVDKYVRTGRVSYEYRNLLLNGADIAVSLLARCGGPGSFFPRAAYVYATQRQWQQKLANISDADQAMLDAMTDQQRVMRYAKLGGMGAMAAHMGMSAAQANRCLTDKRALDRLLDMTRAASDAGVKGTPTFLINGNDTNVVEWDDLEPLLRQAGGT